MLAKSWVPMHRGKNNRIGTTAPWNEVLCKVEQGRLGGRSTPPHITDALGLEVKSTKMEWMSSERACNGLRKKKRSDLPRHGTKFCVK